jgi:hypothetical protein
MSREVRPAVDVRCSQDPSLRPDCGQCFGLCCVAPAFPKSPDFAIAKDAGQPCLNLDAGFRCAIHATRRERGFPGCTVYDCFGAGQQVAQVTFGGRDWRRHPGTAGQMFGAFAVMRQLHEMLWCLDGARELGPARPLLGELSGAFDDIKRLTYGGPDELARLDVAACQRRVNALLLRAGQLVRAAVPPEREKGETEG